MVCAPDGSAHPGGKRKEWVLVDNYTDAKALILEKDVQKGDNRGPCPDGSWLTLGHMDWLQVRPLSGPESCVGIPLDRVDECSQNLSVDGNADFMYRQPLYIFQEFPLVRQEAVDHFWTQPAAFMVITRLHSNGQSQKSFEEAVDQQLQRRDLPPECPDVPIFFWNDTPSGERLDRSVTCLRYRTLELCDIILIAKSDSVESLLTYSGRLYSLPETGDTYSYYCINENEFSPTGGLAVEDDCVSLTSTRFSVRSASACRTLLPSLQKIFANGTERPAFFVTGMEDINLISYDNSSQRICKIFRSILKLDSSFWQAFENCTTRLGIRESVLPLWNSRTDGSLLKEDLAEAYQRLKDSFTYLRRTNRLNQDWVRPLGELINLLSHISQNCVLWQVCYILLNGIQGIIRRVEEWSSNNAFLDDDSNREIMRMVRGVDRLLEHITRMEGELVHQPETRPMLFDIPANLLEFYLFFSDKCAQYLKNREGPDKQESFQLLLIPNLCSRISIHDHLNSGLNKNRLLYIEIPLGLLYEPSHVVCVLVHEVAHHSSEQARNRTVRFQDLLSCTAFILADELDMGDSDAVFLRLRELLDSCYPPDKRDYMQDIFSNLLNTASHIYQNGSYVEELWDLYMNAMSEAPKAEQLMWLNQHVTGYRRYMEEKVLDRLDKLLWEVENLFKETYADLAMLTLLGLRAEDYMAMLEKSDAVHSSKNENSFACKIERAALVLCAIDPTNLLGLAEYAAPSRPLATSILKYCQILLDENVSPEMLPTRSGSCGYHSLEVAASILHYLSVCCESIRQYDALEQNCSAKEEIQSNFREFAVKQRFASLEFFQSLEAYRPQIIHRSE